MHPHSEHHDDIPLPRDAPRATVDGEMLVSQTQLPKHPEVQVGSYKKGSAGEKEDGAPAQREPNQHPVVKFGEHMELLCGKLDTSLVAYIWGRKASMTSEAVTLIGRSLAPLHEFKLQRRPTTWGVFDVQEGHRVAEMRLQYSVATTPGPIQRPRLSDCKQTEVTVQWEPPENDHGAKVIGYKVAIRLDAQRADRNAPAEWLTLCERTTSAIPAYVVTDLVGNSSYTLGIRAVNKVGPGDACEYKVSTAPIAPEPPSKPWIEEDRDGCLNVAWRSPGSDGGCPITAYRIRMRKLLGATSFNQWHGMGPREAHATWADMGTVGAVMCEEQEDLSVFNAWVGPLEAECCEYRFQIFALSRAGESKGSELSDARYV